MKLTRTTFVSMVIASSSGLFEVSRAAVKEPPLKCELNHGAWCIVHGVGEVKFVSKSTGENVWILYDSFWKRDVGVILENAACTDAAADTIQVTKVRRSIVWTHKRWNEATLKLRRDGSCTLRLLVPVDDAEFVSKAATSLTGYVAACMSGKACTDNILSSYVYKLISKNR